MRPKFAVLGLGSTLYPDLCAASVALNAKLERYGLERLCPLAKVDQAAGTNEAISALVGLAVKLVPPELEQEMQAMRDLLCYDPSMYAFKWHGDVDMDRTRWTDDETLKCLSNDKLLNHPHIVSSQPFTRSCSSCLRELATRWGIMHASAQ